MAAIWTLEGAWWVQFIASRRVGHNCATEHAHTSNRNYGKKLVPRLLKNNTDISRDRISGEASLSINMDRER